MRPRQAALVEGKSANFVGSGLASLASAVFLVRDGQMPVSRGSRIKVLEHDKLPGGALDGIKGGKGLSCAAAANSRTTRHACGDQFRSISSLEVPGASLHEVYWLNKDGSSYSLCRVKEKGGDDARAEDKFGLGPQAHAEVSNIFARESMQDKRIDEVFVFGDEFFASNLWIYWQGPGTARLSASSTCTALSTTSGVSEQHTLVLDTRVSTQRNAPWCNSFWDQESSAGRWPPKGAQNDGEWPRKGLAVVAMVDDDRGTPYGGTEGGHPKWRSHVPSHVNDISIERNAVMPIALRSITIHL